MIGHQLPAIRRTHIRNPEGCPSLLVPPFLIPPISSPFHAGTITRLPTAVHIVSIPRARLDALSHPVLRALLHPSPAFLSITCNALELSLFAEPESLRAFDAIARADYASSADGLEPVEISHDSWSVLQIDSHSDQLDNAGARVNELSAPLAAAGISILYQSSYMSDFIFVKERRLAEAMSLFAAAGFALYAADPNLLTALLASPPSPVLTRERSGSAPSTLASRSNSKSSSRSNSHRANSKGKAREKALSAPAPTSATPKKSKSPASILLRDVRVLAPDLACVGLADDAADHWALKIVKLIAFPDLIPLPARALISPPSAYPFRNGTSPVEEEGEDDAGYFSHSPSPTVDDPEPEPEPGPGPGRGDEERVRARKTRACCPRAPAGAFAPRRVPSSLAWLPSADVRVGRSVRTAGVGRGRAKQRLDAASPRQKRNARPPHVEHAIPFFSFTRTPEGSSLTAGAHVLAALFPRAERHMVICGGELDAADREAEAHAAALSPSSESVPVSPVDSYGAWMDEDEFDEFDGEGYGADDADAHPLLSVLQVDLRGAGLDTETHGLVHRFSRALAQGGVNHMYASTLRSANLLVPTGRAGRGARRAGGLLRGC
ncbi:hypothetical protein B0H17DRAFT_1214669 [Mycena rosella]|uniref:CASTOR ACT domain-containing protein n=1 Tax=Mycena rosella TaxID=1033263 RepID=A0AAD7G475_MYCRO|nr:hypothetical protein B0H17DRAFT_1214669 [Mycena rosella]